MPLEITNVVSSEGFIVTLNDGRVINAIPVYNKTARRWDFPDVPDDVAELMSNITGTAKYQKVLRGETPAAHEDDSARSYLVGRQFQQQFIDNTSDTYGITLSTGAGSVVTTVGITDSNTREPIPFTDVAKVGLKMITNNDGTAVIKINGTIVTAGGATIQANIVNGKAAFTISVSSATGSGTVQTFDSVDVEGNGLGTDTATVTLT